MQLYPLQMSFDNRIDDYSSIKQNYSNNSYKPQTSEYTESYDLSTLPTFVKDFYHVFISI